MTTVLAHNQPAAVPDDRPASDETLADLVNRLGGIPLTRIKLRPAPGTATEEDVIRVKCCELLDGVIVEKGMGWEESVWEVEIAGMIRDFIKGKRIAVIAGSDGLSRLNEGQVRIPDVGVYLLSRFPGGKAKRAAICDMAPDWAIEVLSRSNTKREMESKRVQFFAAGTRRMWIVDPRKRTIEDWASAKEMHILTAEDTADLGEILPGFKLPIADWFAEVDAAFETSDEPPGPS